MQLKKEPSARGYKNKCFDQTLQLMYNTEAKNNYISFQTTTYQNTYQIVEHPNMQPALILILLDFPYRNPPYHAFRIKLPYRMAGFS